VLCGQTFRAHITTSLTGPPAVPLQPNPRQVQNAQGPSTTTTDDSAVPNTHAHNPTICTDCTVRYLLQCAASDSILLAEPISALLLGARPRRLTPWYRIPSLLKPYCGVLSTLMHVIHRRKRPVASQVPAPRAHGFVTALHDHVAAFATLKSPSPPRAFSSYLPALFTTCTVDSARYLPAPLEQISLPL
jgi:hypothetical protein